MRSKSAFQKILFAIPTLFLLINIFGCRTDPDLLTSPTDDTDIPDFGHIALVLFENESYDAVIDNLLLPEFNRLAQEYTLLTNYYAITHPSLPNYIALIGGDTFGIQSDCIDCFVNVPSLPDYIEMSGRSWKAYQEDMPEPCFLGNYGKYVQRHNPFIYFDFIREDKARCLESVVPFDNLQIDIENQDLPDFIFITPNLCNDGHDCDLETTDSWTEKLMASLLPALDDTNEPYFVALIFDEGEKHRINLKLSDRSGGHISVILVSPQAKKNFQDNTAYNHYSMLRTISVAWGLPYLGKASENDALPISTPWE